RTTLTPSPLPFQGEGNPQQSVECRVVVSAVARAVVELRPLKRRAPADLHRPGRIPHEEHSLAAVDHDLELARAGYVSHRGRCGQPVAGELRPAFRLAAEVVDGVHEVA